MSTNSSIHDSSSIDSTPSMIVFESYDEKVFIVETRLHQLNYLRKIVNEKNLYNINIEHNTQKD